MAMYIGDDQASQILYADPPKAMVGGGGGGGGGMVGYFPAQHVDMRSYQPIAIPMQPMVHTNVSLPLSLIKRNWYSVMSARSTCVHTCGTCWRGMLLQLTISESQIASC